MTSTAGYTPPGLPTSYRLVDAQGQISELNPTTYQTASDRERRAAFAGLRTTCSACTTASWWSRWRSWPCRIIDHRSGARFPRASPRRRWPRHWAGCGVPDFLGSWAGYWARRRSAERHRADPERLGGARSVPGPRSPHRGAGAVGDRKVQGIERAQARGRRAGRSGRARGSHVRPPTKIMAARRSQCGCQCWTLSSATVSGTSRSPARHTAQKA
jgi:hypothetical protein